ncbi:MAG: DNA repair protein RadA [Armatimonadota bacterium]|nr:MAG: DNA repair protein RadA [Armatimonadota bacterium]
MTKAATIYVCQQCGAEHLRWMGRCRDCGEWNGLVEQKMEAPPARGAPTPSAPAVSIADVPAADAPRRPTGIGELDRVLGGGVVDGSLVLIGGEPGIGKSTLVLQGAQAFAERHGRVLYVSGEESLLQMRMRAQRIGAMNSGLMVAAEIEMEHILGDIESLSPALVIVDSVQTLHDGELTSAPGSVSQVRHCAGLLMRCGKTSATPIFLVGHVTKEGAIAGPRVLEHMVDTVLYLEGDRHLDYRLLRAVKNRFGSTNELGVLQMRESGLAEVANPSAVFLSERRAEAPGSAVIACMEGTRPLLVELQALVSAAPPFGAPRRSSTGLDHNRLSLVLAVLEKRARLGISTQDVFVNIPGGVRVDEPAADLGMAIAIASNLKDRPVRADTVFFGEVGLSGEIRTVNRSEDRMREAARLGFRRCVAPAGGGPRGVDDIELVPVGELGEAFEAGLAAARDSGAEGR